MAWRGHELKGLYATPETCALCVIFSEMAQFLLTAFTERVRNQIKQNVVTVKNTNFVVFFDYMEDYTVVCFCVMFERQRQRKRESDTHREGQMVNER